MKLSDLRDWAFRFKAEGFIFTLGISIGMWAGWTLWKPVPPKPEPYAPSVKQPDGSTILERKPDPMAKPISKVPDGATVERIVQVTVQPLAALPAIPSTGPASILIPAPEQPKIPCPDVHVDLALVRMKDGTRRVVASSKDGIVTGGVDIPVEPVEPVRSFPWAAGGIWNPGDKTYGAFVDRDFAFLRVGAELVQVREPVAAGGRVSVAGFIKVGIRFGGK